MKRFLSYIILLLLFTTHHLAAQKSSQGKIQGRIYNQNTNEPIAFATVYIWGTTIGSVSDLDGNYSFTGIDPGYIKLVASSVGFDETLTEEFQVTNANIAYVDIGLAEADIEIEQVVVKASPFRKKVESPTSLQRIGIEQIEKNPGGNRDVSRVIQSLPGVSSGTSFRNDVIVRGGGPNENSFYLDGVEIPTINHFSTQGASGGPVGIINVDFVREINLYTGAFPTNIGNSMSSVIDMRQIDGNREKLKFRGSIGSSDLSLTLDGPISKKTSFVASVRRSYLQFLFSALELPFLPTYNDFQFKTKTRINEKNEISFIGLGALDQFNLNLDANDTPEQRYLLSTLPVNNQWNYTFGAVYKHYHSKGFDSFVASRSYLNNTSFKYPDNDESQEKSLDYKSAEIENKIRYERNLNYSNGLKVNFGLGGTYAKYFNNTTTQAYDNDGLYPIVYETSIDMFHYSAFGQVGKAFYKNRLSTSFGLRADGSSYSEEMINPFDQLSPRLALSYALTPRWSVNFNTGKYYQRPPYTSMGYKTTEGILINKKNGLKYIESNQVVAGFAFNPNVESLISVEGFYKQYADYPFSKIDSIPLSTKGADFDVLGAEEVYSISDGRAYGFEVLARSQNISKFNLILAYTFVRSEFKDLRSESRGEYIPSSWDNKHLLNLTGTRKFKRNWYFGFKWRYLGGTPYSPYDEDKSSIKDAWDAKGSAYIDYGSFNELRFGSYHQLDIRIDKEYYFDKWTLNFYLDIQNIYNSQADQQDALVRKSFIDPEYNDQFTDSEGVERYELEYLPNTGGGTILPTIGIIVEF